MAHSFGKKLLPTVLGLTVMALVLANRPAPPLPPSPPSSLTSLSTGTTDRSNAAGMVARAQSEVTDAPIAIGTASGGLDPDAVWPSYRHDSRNTGSGE